MAAAEPTHAAQVPPPRLPALPLLLLLLLLRVPPPGPPAPRNLPSVTSMRLAKQSRTRRSMHRGKKALIFF
jgi:hypothetical protein